MFHSTLQGKIFNDDSELLDQVINDLTGKEYESVVLSGNSYGVRACERIAAVLESNHSLKECHFADMFTGRLLTEIPQCLTFFF
jgi:Ran GTPase-activating protein 1